MASVFSKVQPPFQSAPRKEAGSAEASTTASATREAARPTGLLGRLRGGVETLDVGPRARLFRNAGVFLLVIGLVLGAEAIRTSQENLGYQETLALLEGGVHQVSGESALASLGAEQAFIRVGEARTRVEAAFKALRGGGITPGGRSISATPERLDAQLAALGGAWNDIAGRLDVLQHASSKLVGLARDVEQLNRENARLLELSEQVVALLVQAGVPIREVAVASQMPVLSQRISKNANLLLGAQTIDSDVAFLMAKDVELFRKLLNGLGAGSSELRLTAVADRLAKERLTELDQVFASHEKSALASLGAMQTLVDAKQATSEIPTLAERLIGAIRNAAPLYTSSGAVFALAIAAAGFAAASLACFFLLGKIFFDDARRRAVASEELNRRNQEAIVRLLQEITHLSDGDLTVRAKVTDDITGSIADAVNFAVDEMAELVRQIDHAGTLVDDAVSRAESMSADMHAAGEAQVNRIQTGARGVLGLIKAINAMTQRMQQAAGEARQGVEVAEQGAKAVQASIDGMNQIRTQVQETAKRIKRLGESSQEISQIVDLISEISEHTHVLAINAAVQAAAAGEAGRGFSVVAEEVQHLAARVNDAVRRIARLVKTIQDSSYELVASMESTTGRVVDGARASEGAMHALEAIGATARGYANIADEIAGGMDAQTRDARAVAQSMTSILEATHQAQDGIGKLSESVARLADLSKQLRSTVAQFRMP